MNNKMTWDEVAQKRLAALWQDKLSGSEIAAIINKEFNKNLSRCSILGQARRMGLSRSPSALDSTHSLNFIVTNPTRKPLDVDIYAGDLSSTKTLFEAKSSDCHYPYDDGLICGRAVCDSHPSYCEFHFKKCYTHWGKK